MYFKLVSLSLLLIFTNNVFAKPFKDVSLIGKTKLLSKQSSTTRSQKYTCDDKFLKSYVPGEVIVKFKTNPESNGFNNKSLLRNSTESISYKKVFDTNYSTTGKSRLKNNSFNFDKVYLLTIDDISHKYLKQEPVLKDDCERTLALMNDLNTDSDVEYAEPNIIYTLLKSLNDPILNLGVTSSGYDPAWGINKIQARQAWDLSTGKGVRVAVIDSGVDFTHPDLSKNIPNNGLDFINSDSYAEDVTGHGTHVAGIIASIGNNNKGSAGIAFEAEVLPYKVFTNKGGAPVTAIVDAIYDAVVNSSSIINLSLGFNETSQTMEQVCDFAYENNVIVVAASGNGGEDGIGDNQEYYPAAYNSVISVGASNVSDVLSSFSNYGSWVHVSAPGEDIFSTFSYNALNNCIAKCIGEDQIAYLDDSTYGYARSPGTSMAAPHVSGLAALIKSYWQEFNVDQIFSLIYYTTDPLQGGSAISGGRINAADALSAAQTVKSTWAVDINRDGSFTNSEIANYIWNLRKTAKFFNEKHDVNNDGLTTYLDDQIIFNLAIKPQGQAFTNLYNSYYAAMSIVDKKIDGILIGKERISYKKTIKKLIKNNKYDSRYDVNFDGAVNNDDVQLISTVFGFVGISL
jgi:hypothetical protein